jgi:hypothetical protein
MSDTKNEKAWELLFNNYSILSEIHKQAYYIISSTDINRVREK